MTDLSENELLGRVCAWGFGTKQSVERANAAMDEITRRFAALNARISEYEGTIRTLSDLRHAAEKERNEAREESRLHVECMCGHLADDHDGECQEFRVGGGGQETECDCQNFRPAWAEWWKRADEAEACVVVLENALRRAAFVAEGLMQMIDPQTWRDTGGDDGQGHYEGDYRAEQLASEIREWKAIAALGVRAEEKGGGV